MVRGVSTTLFQVQKMKVTASISMLDSKGLEPTWYSMFRGTGGSYLSFTSNASLKIKYVKDKLVEGYGNNDDWSRQEQLYITHRNIGGFKMDLQLFYKRFQRPNLFQYDDKDIPVSINTGNRDIVISKFDSGQICSFEPAIIVTQEGTIYPGVIMRINMRSQEVRMTVSEFESFYDLIVNLRLHDIGINLLQTYLIMLRGIPKQEPEKSKPSPAYILFEQKSQEDSAEEQATTSTPMIKSPTSLDDLGGYSYDQ